ncbi:MAG TPA: hypothetical protein EYP35_02705, partial [Desulfobacterales bacterium]|nr:hypothetical protein [Desulfobacterales bacterium]
SKNGGHLSSTMGATDLIVAMHKVFDVSSSMRPDTNEMMGNPYNNCQCQGGID